MALTQGPPLTEEFHHGQDQVPCRVLPSFISSGSVAPADIVSARLTKPGETPIDGQPADSTLGADWDFSFEGVPSDPNNPWTLTITCSGGFTRTINVYVDEDPGQITATEVETTDTQGLPVTIPLQNVPVLVSTNFSISGTVSPSSANVLSILRVKDRGGKIIRHEFPLPKSQTNSTNWRFYFTLDAKVPKGITHEAVVFMKRGSASLNSARVQVILT